MRGEEEAKALNRIRTLLFCDDLQQPFKWYGKTAYNCSDEEFKICINCCCNTRMDVFYGLSSDDRYEVLNALRTARENPEPSKFPDFIINGGFIEHFTVTASKQTRKGASERISLRNFENKIKNEVDDFCKYCESNPINNQIRSKSWNRKAEKCSYENLVKSIKTNLEKHLESLDKYTGPKDLSVFILENDEVNLEMMENSLENLKEGLRYSYPIRQEHFNRYMLSRDKEILNYLYGFRNKIKYIIYFFEESFEIIKSENIPELIKCLPYEYVIKPRDIGMVKTISNLQIKYSMDVSDE